MRVARSLGLFVFALAMSAEAFAQADRIITVDGDTIACTIDLVRADRLHYTMIEDGRQKHRRIDKELVSFYHQVGYAPVDLRQELVSSGSYEEPVADTSDERTMHVVAGFGLTNLLGDVDESAGTQFADYQKSLRAGKQLHLGFTQYMGPRLGVGVHASHSLWSAAQDDVGFATPDTTVLLDLETDVAITSVGPFLVWRPTDPEGDATFTLMGTLGMSFYTEAGTFSGAGYRAHGSSFHYGAQAGLDLHITRTFTLGAVAGYRSGKVTDVSLRMDNGLQVPLELGEGQEVDLRRFYFGAQIGIVY